MRPFNDDLYDWDDYADDYDLEWEFTEDESDSDKSDEEE
jgi:hypothetical protein